MDVPLESLRGETQVSSRIRQKVLPEKVVESVKNVSVSADGNTFGSRESLSRRICFQSEEEAISRIQDILCEMYSIQSYFFLFVQCFFFVGRCFFSKWFFRNCGQNFALSPWYQSDMKVVWFMSTCMLFLQTSLLEIRWLVRLVFSWHLLISWQERKHFWRRRWIIIIRMIIVSVVHVLQSRLEEGTCDAVSSGKGHEKNFPFLSYISLQPKRV